MLAVGLEYVSMNVDDCHIVSSKPAEFMDVGTLHAGTPVGTGMEVFSYLLSAIECPRLTQSMVEPAYLAYSLSS